MVEYEKAIGRPFTDVRNLIVAVVIGVLSAIPVEAVYRLTGIAGAILAAIIIVVSSLLLQGYALEVGRTSTKKIPGSLPGWQNIGQLLLRGFSATIVILVYSIPVIVLAVLTIIAIFGFVFLSSTFSGNASPAAPLAAGGIGILLLFVTLIVGIVTAYVLPVAQMHYAAERRFGAGFELGTVFGKAFRSSYLVAWLVAVVYSIAVGMVAVLLFIPALFLSALLPALGIAVTAVVSGIAMALITITAYSIYGAAYGEK